MLSARKLQALGPIFIAIIAAVGALSLQRSHHARQQQIAGRANYARQEERLAASLAIQTRLPALGFDNIAADWAYLQFIQYYGDTDARNHAGYALVDDYFEAVIARDPRIWRANLILSASTSLYGGRPDRAVELLGKTIPFQQQNSYGAYYTRTYRAVDQILFLGDNEGARRSYESAAPIADAIPDELLARRARETASFLAADPDSRRVRIGAWFQILTAAIDEETQRRALEEIQALGGKIEQDPNGALRVTVPENLR